MAEKIISIIGINCFSHNSSIALVQNGEIKFHLEEERFDRVKFSSAFPINALKQALDSAQLKIEDVDRIAFFIQPWNEILGNLRHFLRFFPRSLNLFSTPLGGSARLGILSRFYKMMTVRSEIARHFPGQKIPKVTFVEHHLAHVASCFHLSPFQEAAVLIMDGRGESSSILMAEGDGRAIKKILEVKVPSSIGHFYAAMTEFLGFKSFYDEWKVMGMGAHGNPVYVEEFRRILRKEQNGFSLNLDFFEFHFYGPSKWFSKSFFELFGEARKRDEELTQKHFDIAKSFQIVVEEVAVDLAKQLRAKTGSNNLCLAGGVVLNILMNSKIIEHSGFDNFFIQPIASDTGTSLGSAVYVYHHHFKRPRDLRFWSPYLGLAYSKNEMRRTLSQYGLNFQDLNNDFSPVAKLISDRKIVGWFQGRMEAGPRSLGNRAILADPRSQEVKDQLNLRIKHREKFRPFAPSVTEEDVLKYFETPKNVNSPYMIISGRTKAEVVSILPAVTHVDGTARVHTVNKIMNPRFWNLLKEFEKISGIPILLNTSFNEQEPIVENPEQAVNCYLRTKMDALVLGDFLVIR